MMSTFNFLIRLLLTFSLIVSIAGCAGSKVSESTGEYLDDVAITSKVKTAILGDSRLKSMDISVETFKGVVQLNGFVDSSSVVKRAVDLARTIKGVKMVKNNLDVK